MAVKTVSDVDDGEHGPHSDHERIIESGLCRFVRFDYGIVADLACEIFTGSRGRRPGLVGRTDAPQLHACRVVLHHPETVRREQHAGRLPWWIGAGRHASRPVWWRQFAHLWD